MGSARRSIEQALFWLAVLGFLVAVAFGWFGAAAYLDEAHVGWSVSDRIYVLLQAFTLQLPFDPQGVSYPPGLQVARFLGPTVLAYAAVATLIAIFREAFDEEIRVRWRGRGDGHIIICGLGYVGGSALRQLAAPSDPSARRHRVVAIELEGTSGDVGEARRWDVPVILGDATEAPTWRRAGLLHARHVLVACGHDQFNGEAAAVARQLLIAAGRRDTDIVVHLHSPTLGDRQWRRLRDEDRRDEGAAGVAESQGEDCGSPTDGASRRYATFREAAPPVSVFNINVASAQRLLVRHPPFPPGAPGSPRVVVVGSGRFARALLVHLGHLWSATVPLDKGPLEVVLADPDADRVVAELVDRFADARDVLAITEVPDLGAANLAETLVGGRGDTRVYICQRDEATGLDLALRVADEIERYNVVGYPREASAAPLNPVLVRTGRAAGLADIVAGADWKSRQRVQPFSPVALSCDAVSLFGSPDERLARMAHEAYEGLAHTFPDRARDPSEPSFFPWERLPPAMQDGNRAQVAGMRATWAMLGVPASCPLEPLETLGVPLEIDATHPLTDDDLWVLAEREHERWITAKQEAGFVYGPIRKGNEHPDMAPWPELDFPTQRKDREAVLAYVRGLAAMGLRLPQGSPVDPPPQPDHRVGRLAANEAETVARLLHDQHRRLHPEGRTGATAWEDLAEGDLRANLAAASAIIGHAHAMGYEVRHVEGEASVVELPPAAVESASIREHDRWCEQRRSDGWTHGPDRDEQRRLHPDLVPWTELDEPTREKDRERVRIIPEVLARLDLELHPTRL